MGDSKSSKKKDIFKERLEMGGIVGFVNNKTVSRLINEDGDEIFKTIAREIKSKKLPIENIFTEAITLFLKLRKKPKKKLNEEESLKILLLFCLLREKKKSRNSIDVHTIMKMIAIDAALNEAADLLRSGKDEQAFEIVSNDPSGIAVIAAIAEEKQTKAHAGSKKGKGKKEKAYQAWLEFKGDKSNAGAFTRWYIQHTGGEDDNSKPVGTVTERTLREWVNNDFKHRK